MRTNKCIECPNCGAQMEASQLLEVECPYCGSKFQNPLNKEDGDESIIKKIIPFSVSEEDVKEILFDEFVNQKKVPANIFDKLKMLSLEKYYLPMYLFSGEYEATWSCTVVNHKGKDRNGNNIYDYTPQNGVVHGTFHKLTLAGKGFDIPTEVKNYAEVFSNISRLKTKAVKFEPSYLVNDHGNSIKVANCDITKDDAWNKDSLQTSIDNDAKLAAYHQTKKWTTKDYQVSTTFSGRLEDILLVPIWYGKYSYDGQEFFYAMDGQGGHYNKTLPSNSSYNKIIWRYLIVLFVLGIMTYIFGVMTCWSGDTEPIIWAVSIGGTLLLTTHFIEYNKCVKDIKINKQIGKALFCKERLPNISSKYIQFKRINKLLIWGILIIAALIGSISIISAKLKEQEREQNYIQSQQEIEQLLKQKQNDIEDEITPDLFFNKSKSQIGHLRQDIPNSLETLGFVKEDDSNAYYRNLPEKYTLYFHDLELLSVTINDIDYHDWYNKKDNIKEVRITIEDERLESSLLELFKSQLTVRDFAIIDTISFKRPEKSYMRKGKELHYKRMNKSYATWDAAVIEGNEIKCYSKDEIEQDMPTWEKEEVEQEMLKLQNEEIADSLD